MKYLNILFILIISLSLNSCASNGIDINNNIPKTKVILESNPDKKTFYSDTYKSVTQRIYHPNIQIFHLTTGANQFPLNKKDKEYAIYFILPPSHNIKIQNWKYLVSPTKHNKFTISQKNILKN